ncbi:KRFT protein, partial [Semnornis frantzii]|nr:KRFT protein [Semnornis frantzii]
SCLKPCAYSTSLGPSFASCGDSTAVIQPSPVFVTLPGPVIATCPQETIVGSVEGSGPALSSGSSSWNTSRMLTSSGSGGNSGS